MRTIFSYILRTIIVVFICICPLEVYAQTNTLHGFVLNEDLEPIPHAIIEDIRTYTMVESNSSGYYSIIIPKGRMKIKVYAEGYKPLNVDIDDHSLLDVILIPKDIKKKRSQYVTIPWDIQTKLDLSSLSDIAKHHYQRDMYEDALALWREGERKGSALCLYKLGIMHLNGYGIPSDERTAYSCIHISAINGFDGAQVEVGNSYCNGKFTRCDTAMAIYWYGKAAAQGNEVAIAKLASLSKYKDSTRTETKKCIAFLLANSNYWKGNSLPIVKNDTKLLAGQLKAIGIDTWVCENLNKPEMYDSIDAFARAAQNYDLAMFYYSGLSAQAKGTNYLIPIGKIQQTSETGILADCIDVEYLFKCLSDNGVDSKIVILDACRDNRSVFGKKDYGTHLGLSSSSLNPYGSFVAYPAQPNAIAEYKGEETSSFVNALVKVLRIPNLQIYELFELVKTIVSYETDGHQIPVYMNNLKDRVILNTNNQ